MKIIVNFSIKFPKTIKKQKQNKTKQKNPKQNKNKTKQTKNKQNKTKMCHIKWFCSDTRQYDIPL